MGTTVYHIVYIFNCHSPQTPRSPDQAKVCVRSEGASPSYTRTSSSPTLNDTPSHLCTSFASTDESPLIEVTTTHHDHLIIAERATSISVNSAGQCSYVCDDAQKQLSTDSTDSSSEPESCLIKDRTSSSRLTMSGDKNVGSLCAEVGGCEDTHTLGSEDVEVGGCEDEDVVEFCVGDVRKRLSQHSTAPKKTYQRDPEDPSGETLTVHLYVNMYTYQLSQCTCTCTVFLLI